MQLMIDKNEKQTAIFHHSLKETLSFQNSNENREYLLISIDKINVYWMIKIIDNLLSNDFISLLKFILPLNVFINGFYFSGSLTQKEIDNKTLIYSDNLKHLKAYFDTKFYVYSNIKEITNNIVEIDGNYIQIEKNKIKIINKSNTIILDNLSKIFEDNYIILASNICPLIITNKSNFLISELYSNSIGIYYSDFNILIENVENLTEEEKKALQLSYQKKSETVYKTVI